MASEIEEWVERTRAALDAGKTPCLPTDSEFEKMCPALQTAEVTLSFWWLDGRAESKISMPFSQWLDIIRGERYECQQPREPFEDTFFHLVWTFSSAGFTLGDYEDCVDYCSGGLEQLYIESSTPGVARIASLALCLQPETEQDEGN